MTDWECLDPEKNRRDHLSQNLLTLKSERLNNSEAIGSAYIPIKDDLKGRARDSTMVHWRSERFQLEKFVC